METYWEGWGKKTGKENKRWKRRYLRLHGMEGGARGLFYYDDERATGTKGAMWLLAAKRATGGGKPSSPGTASCLTMNAAVVTHSQGQVRPQTKPPPVPQGG